MRLEIQISVCLARARWYRPRAVFESISVCFIGSRWNKRHTYVTVVAHIVSLHFVMERNVLFLIKNVLELLL